VDVLLIQGKGFNIPFWPSGVADLFPVGNELEGRVLSSTGHNRAIVLFRGVLVMAATSRHLEEGSVIRVRVVGSGAPPILQMISQAPAEEKKLLSILRTYIPIEPKPVSEWLSGFRSELNFARNWFYQEIPGNFPCEEALDRIGHLLINEDRPRPSTQQIRSFLVNSGLGYEAKIIRRIAGDFPKLQTHPNFFLEDTKGILMTLDRELRNLQRMHPQSSEKMDGLLQRLGEGLQHIEHQQVMHAFSKQDEGYLGLQIPVQFKDERTTLWIKVRPQGNKEGKENEKDSSEMVFFLELRSLGKLRINTFLQSNSISCRIEADSNEVVAFIKPFLPELGESLILKGYQVKLLECVKTQIPETIQDLSPKSILPSGLRMVDIVI